LLRTPRTLFALLPAMLVPGVAQVLGAIPPLRRYLLHERPTVLLSALDFANITAIVAGELAGVPGQRVVASVHNHLTSAVANAERGHLRRIVPLARRFYPRAASIVAVSAGVAADLAERLALPLERITTIYNPVITPRIATLASAALTHRWFANDAPPVILGVGKLRRQKDFATLIRAFAIVRQSHDARLLVLGEGPERASLERLAQSLGCAETVELAGFDPNPYRFMARAAVFALSSAWEGFGNVLVEAMACGCPVVSTACTSGPAEILADGCYGPLVPVGDAAALAQALRQQLDTRGDRDPGIERARQFSDVASAACYERVLFPQTNAAAASTGE
jgi:glycosyltransferase involved in cell wall biosynthesis